MKKHLSIGLMLILPAHLSLAEPATPERHKSRPGRLFYSPAERDELDSARRLGLAPEKLKNTRALRLEGVVIGPSGSTLWINGQPVRNHTIEAGHRIESTSDPTHTRLSPIDPAAGGRPAQLKVGEIFRTPSAP
jgi:hypothetical protein